MRRMLFAASMVLILTACAKPTPYQPATDGYGFTEQRIEDNRFRITFHGNSVTPQPVVEDYMLYRAAEITRHNGYDYFEIADKDTDKDTRYLTTYSDPMYPYYAPYSRRGFYPYPYAPSFQTGTTRPIVQYTVSANVVLYRGKKPADNVEAYDARDVIERLRPTVRFPPPATSR
jgi:hypothetical protein